MNMPRILALAGRIIRQVVSRLPSDRSQLSCGCSSALRNAVMTDPSLISTPLRERYGLLLGKYLG